MRHRDAIVIDDLMTDDDIPFDDDVAITSLPPHLRAELFHDSIGGELGLHDLRERPERHRGRVSLLG